MQAHEERVVAEKKELDDKLSKLRPFLETPIFNKLQIQDQELLVEQSLVNG
jgi:hypothetical protein